MGAVINILPAEIPDLGGELSTRVCMTGVGGGRQFVRLKLDAVGGGDVLVKHLALQGRSPKRAGNLRLAHRAIAKQEQLVLPERLGTAIEVIPIDLEYDHSHRRNRSKLLPDHLHVARALNDLPTQGRIFGVVNVNTSRENKLADGSRKSSGEFLKIQVSRDRLVANKAFSALKDAVRQSIDYYATLKRRSPASSPTFSSLLIPPATERGSPRLMARWWDRSFSLAPVRFIRKLASCGYYMPSPKRAVRALARCLSTLVSRRRDPSATSGSTCGRPAS